MYSSVPLLVLAAGSVYAKVQYAGINIAGMEFGCDFNGNCDISQVAAPLTTLNGSDGAGQMNHFVNDDQLNIFRLPVGWQYLTDNALGAPLDTTNFGAYDQLVQACLTTGASCIIDIHNYARFNGQIIGQDDGGPTNDQFADIWSQLATKYKSQSKVVFGIMNEPHDLDVDMWSATVQAAVTAIRNAGANDQMILLPGTNFSSAAAFVDSGSAAALGKVVNPDKSTKNLIFDVHRYLDEDNTGTNSACDTDNVNSTFVPLADYLRSNKRQALLSETGGGANETSCLTDLCAETTFLNANEDVFLGYLGWGAGSFDQTYILSETPSIGAGGSFVDNALVQQCIVGTRNASKSNTKSDGQSLVPRLASAALVVTAMLFALL